MAPDLREVYNVLEIYSRQHVDLYVRGLLKTPAPLYRNALGIVEMVRTDGAKATLIQLRQWFQEAEGRAEQKPTPQQAAPTVKPNPVAEVIDHFRDGWRKLYSKTYPITDKDAVILNQLIKKHGLDDLKTMMTRFLDTTIPFFTDTHHDLKQFVRTIPQWMVDAPTTTKRGRAAIGEANKNFNARFEGLKGGRVNV